MLFLLEGVRCHGGGGNTVDKVSISIEIVCGEEFAMQRAWPEYYSF